METSLENSVIFDRGQINPYGKYFSGTSYLNLSYMKEMKMGSDQYDLVRL